MHQETRLRTGAFANFEQDTRLGSSVCQQTFEEWVRARKANAAALTAQSGWNKVSLLKLLTGRH